MSRVKDPSDNTLATYKWLADGRKASAVNGDNTFGLEYLGSLVYKKSGGTLELESAAFGGGRIMKSSNSYLPHYFIADHLGSTRVVIGPDGPAERNNYHSFGQRWNTSGSAITSNRYRFSGKEEQDEFGFDYLDFGARMYDSEIGRWWSVDPLAGLYMRHSPFAYCLNNPVNAIDRDGRSSFTLYGAAAQSAVATLQKLYPHWGEKDEDDEDEEPEWPYKSQYDAHLVHGKPSDGTGKEQKTGLTPAQMRQAKKLIREFRQYNEYLMHNPMPEWAFDGEIPADALYEAWSNALSNAAMGVMPFTMFKGITWFSRLAKGSATAESGTLLFKKETFQHMFSRHAADFGITANWSKATALEFERALRGHMNGLKPIKGTWRNAQPALHYYNPATGLNVSTTLDGYLLGGWKLGQEQVYYLFTTGNIR